MERKKAMIRLGFCDFSKLHKLASMLLISRAIMFHQPLF